MTKIQAAIITISDTRSRDDDLSGDRLEKRLHDIGAEIASRHVVTDDLEGITHLLLDLAKNEQVNLVMTTGGTGLGPRDNTPEATLAVIERQVPGIPEAMRRETYDKTPMSMLSRGVCGIRGNTLIINLPGSPRAVEECFEVIRPVLSHAIDLISGDTRH